MLRNLGIGRLWIFLAVMSAPGAVRAADERPYVGSVDVKILATTDPVDDSIHVLGTMEGNTSALGKFTGWVAYRIDLGAREFDGRAIKVAANGDQLYETLSGQFTDATLSRSVGELTLDGGSGRFSDAAGRARFTTVSRSATEVSAQFHGTFSYDASNRADISLADSDAFDSLGQAIFGNIQGALSSGQLAFYTGVGASRLTGLNVQTGSIQPTSALKPVSGEPGTFQFTGVVGPHPELGTRVHVVTTAKGDIYCKWTALFTIEFVNDEGDAIFSGDGDFTVLGGTGHYRKASGTFRTHFKSQVIQAGADTAIAGVTQEGTIAR